MLHYLKAFYSFNFFGLVMMANIDICINSDHVAIVETEYLYFGL